MSPLQPASLYTPEAATGAEPFGAAASSAALPPFARMPTTTFSESTDANMQALRRILDAQRQPMVVKGVVVHSEATGEEATGEATGEEAAGEATDEATGEEAAGETAARAPRVVAYPGGLIHVEGQGVLTEIDGGGNEETGLVARAIAAARRIRARGDPPKCYRALLEESHELAALPYRPLAPPPSLGARTGLDDSPLLRQLFRPDHAAVLTPEMRFHLACAAAAAGLDGLDALEGYVEVDDPRGVVYVEGKDSQRTPSGAKAAALGGIRYWVVGPYPLLCVRPSAGGDGAGEGTPSGARAAEGTPSGGTPSGGTPSGARAAGGDSRARAAGGDSRATVERLLRKLHETPPAALDPDFPELPQSVPRLPIPQPVLLALRRGWDDGEPDEERILSSFVDSVGGPSLRIAATSRPRLEGLLVPSASEGLLVPSASGEEGAAVETPFASAPLVAESPTASHRIVGYFF